VVAQERVVRAARDEIGVERGLPPPPLERPERALAAQLGEDQRAVGTLLARERVLVEPFECRERRVDEGITSGERLRGETAEAVVVLVNAGDRSGDRLQGEPVEDERARAVGEGGRFR